MTKSLSDYKIEIIGILAAMAVGIAAAYVGPIFVLAGVIAIVGIAFMLYKPDHTTVIILFVLYANIAVVATKFYGIPPFIAGGSFMLLVIPIVNYLFIQRRGLIVDQIFMLMALYGAFLMISGVLSGQIDDSLDRILGYFVEGFILYFLVVNALRSKDMLRKATWGLIAAGALMGSLSMYQELTKSYDNQFGGLAQVKESVIGTGEIDTAGKKIKRRRLAGPVGSKNRYAQIMVVLLPLAFFRILGEKSKGLKLVAAASCVPILAGALLTFSRGAGITVVLLLVLMTLMRYIKIRQFILAGVLAVLVVLIAVPDYVNRTILALEGVTSVVSADVAGADNSVRGRATVGLAAFNMFLDNPFFGVGPGLTASKMIEYTKGIGFRQIDTERRAHNMYIEELSDTGIIGFLTFLAIIFMALYPLYKLRQKHRYTHVDMSNLATGYMLALIAYLFTAVFLHLSYVRYYWVVIALCGAAINIFQNELHDAEERGNEADNSEEASIKKPTIEKFPKLLKPGLVK